MGQLQCVSGLTQLKSVCFIPCKHFLLRKSDSFIPLNEQDELREKGGVKRECVFGLNMVVWCCTLTLLHHTHKFILNLIYFFFYLLLHTQVCFCLSIHRGSSLNTSEGVRLQCFSTYLVVSVVHSCEEDSTHLSGSSVSPCLLKDQHVVLMFWLWPWAADSDWKLFLFMSVLYLKLRQHFNAPGLLFSTLLFVLNSNVEQM